MNIGHNQDHLRQIASVIKELMDKKDEVSQEITDKCKEAKDAGFDITSIKKVISEQRKREKDVDKYREQRDLFDFMAEVIAPELNK